MSTRSVDNGPGPGPGSTQGPVSGPPPHGPPASSRTGQNRHRRVPEQERKRASRACDGCRRQKEKCFGGVPCRRCTRLFRPCEFSSPSAKDDLPPLPSDGPSASAPARQDVSELVQRMASMERLLVHYVGNISLDAETLRDMADTADRGGDPGTASPAAGRGKARADEDEDEDEGSSEDYPKADITVQPLENNAAHYSGEFSHWNFSMRIKNWIEQCAPPQDCDTPNIKEFYRADDLPLSADTLSLVSSLPPRYVADFLVRAFYHHAVTNYFLVDRAWLVAKVDQIYKAGSQLNRRDVPSLCIMLIVFAIGTQFAYLESRPARRPGDPPPGPASETTGSFSEDSVGLMFYQSASRLVPDIITIASLESVQACALIGLYTVPLDASGLSYVYWNLAVRLAIQNGMHRKYTGDNLDPAVRETRNRVWWTVYTFERRIGIFHGRPASISTAEIDAELPVDRPPDARIAAWPSDIPHQLATLHINSVLESVAKPISLFKTNQRQSIIDALAALVAIKDRLHLWWDNLDAGTTHSDVPSRASLHLRLEYLSVRMFAGRIFITPREPSAAGAGARSNPSPASTDMTAAASSRKSSVSSNAQRRAAMVADCVEAALSIVETCRLLRATIGLARASYTEYGSCRAALLVLIAQCLQRPSEELREALREGIAMLREMSAAGDSARFDVALIEAFEAGVARMCAAAGAAGSPPEADYEGFKKWEMLWQSEALQGDPRLETGLEAAFGFPSRGGQGVGPAQGAWGGQPMATLSSGGPFFGVDGSLSTMPILDDLSAMFGGGYGHLESTMGSGDGSWAGL